MEQSVIFTTDLVCMRDKPNVSEDRSCIPINGVSHVVIANNNWIASSGLWPIG